MYSVEWDWLLIIGLFIDIDSTVLDTCIVSRQFDKILLCYLTRLLHFHIFCSVKEKEALMASR
jgi:hypothetical protein